jgi:hypothetical protein
MANYIKATNFTAKDALPTGNPGKIIKGTEIDVEYTAIATAIGSKADTNSPTFTGTPTAPTASPGTSNTQIATTAFVSSSSAASIPAGIITMWSGSIAAIPTGWYLCNGSNGTPDLRDRFIVGAGSSYAVGGTGGSKDAIVVSHTHSFTGSGSTASAGSHQHPISTGAVSGSIGLASATNWQSPGGLSLGQTVAAGEHTHSLSISGTTGSTGSSGTNANLPPYYALAYIMKA